MENRLHYMLDVFLGKDGWAKRAGEAAMNMELLAKVNLFILQRLKGKISKSIPRIQLLLAKLSPMQLFELELYIEREYASALPNREGITRIQRYLRMRPVGVTFSCFM